MTDYIVEHLLEIIAIIAAFAIFFLQLRRKVIDYTIITNTSVVSVSDTVKDNIQILYKGEIVPSLRLIEIRIRNAGNLPIKPDDYVQPLVIRHPSFTALSVDLMDTNYLGAYIETEMSGLNDIVLSKTLLNPKDFYDIKLLVMDGGIDLSIDEDIDLSVVGRIVGVPKIQKRMPRSLERIMGRLLAIVIAASSIGLYVTTLYFRRQGLISLEIEIASFLVTFLIMITAVNRAWHLRFDD